MKHLSLLSVVLFVSCATYKQFITVTPPQAPIPKGTTEFTFASNLDEVGRALSANQIMFQRNENGIMTEEFLIDQGTRAQYRLYEMDGMIKCTPYWGITGQVQSQVALWAGQAAATGSGDMRRVVYNSQETRPATVFHYAVQLFSPVAQLHYK